MTTSTHPAASLETLSRHHDGELSPAERVAFETHLAGCAECREAAAGFERSLTAFRAAPEAPVPPDLSARILRKLRAQTPTRRPFGVMFGIDIRWAGVFLAALLVVIIAPLFFERRQVRARPPASEPLTAYVVDESSDKRDLASRAPQAAADTDASTKVVPAPPPMARERSEEPKMKSVLDQTAPAPARAPLLVGGAPAPAPASAPESAAAQKLQPAPAEGARNSASALAARRSAPAPEKAGGEAGFVAKEEAQSDDVHLDVRALDSDGAAPDVVQTPPAGSLAPLRGREFVLVVEADGYVRSIAEAERRDRSLEKDVPAPADAVAASDAPLRQLRFRSTGKARKLLVAVR